MNVSYVNWYLVELRRRLHDTMPLDQENSFIFETKNHLESLTSDLIAQGMEPSKAEIAAIERFGSPDTVASQCLIGLRSVRERKIIFAAAVALFGFLVLYCLAWIQTSFVGAELGPAIPIIIALALYALLIGRVPSWRWFALPLACTVMFGAVYAKSQTYVRLSPYRYNGQWQNYGELHSHYAQLKSQQAEAANIEHSAAEEWRKNLRDAKDLGAKDKMSIARITYAVPSAAEPVLHDLRRNGYYQFDQLNMTALVSASNNRATFQYMPVRSSLELQGPLTAHDIRKAIEGRLTEVRQRAKQRDRLLGAYEEGLNKSVLDRFGARLEDRLIMYGAFAIPISLLACFLTSRIRNRVRFKPNKLRLA